MDIGTEKDSHRSGSSDGRTPSWPRAVHAAKTISCFLVPDVIQASRITSAPFWWRGNSLLSARGCSRQCRKQRQRDLSAQERSGAAPT